MCEMIQKIMWRRVCGWGRWIDVVISRLIDLSRSLSLSWMMLLCVVVVDVAANKREGENSADVRQPDDQHIMMWRECEINESSMLAMWLMPMLLYTETQRESAFLLFSLHHSSHHHQRDPE